MNTKNNIENISTANSTKLSSKREFSERLDAQLCDHWPKSKINANVPAIVLAELAKRKGQYTDMVSVFHCIQIAEVHWIGVAGDGNNGSYEWFSVHHTTQCSDCGYGSTDYALKVVLNKFVL